jgi:hypothetical protein
VTEPQVETVETPVADAPVATEPTNAPPEEKTD